MRNKRKSNIRDIAHELLHVGLSHQSRCQGRDPYLWNVACDYIINGWLVEMGLGEPPKIGALYDIELKGLSAEAIYDKIVLDIRTYRKLATLRGIGLGDMMDKNTPDWWTTGDGMSLDDFYRHSLCQGLTYHEEQGQGYLPAGLIEEIRALSQPAIDLIEKAEDFPKDGPLLIITDGYCEPLKIHREHAFLIPKGNHLPFVPKGKVFRFS